jgi:hypothetical protein
VIRAVRTSVRLAVAAVLAAAALACTTRTEVVTSWAAPGANKATVKKVLVLGISKDNGIRRTYEDGFALKLGEMGYHAIPGYRWVPDAAQFNRDEVAARVKAEGVTHVLITRLVGTKTVTTETAPTVVAGYGYAPYGPGWYGSWGTYYAGGYGAVVSPGYTTVNDVVTLETNFYDASKEADNLVWTGQSETWIDQSGPSQKKVGSVIGALVYEMKAKKVI